MGSLPYAIVTIVLILAAGTGGFFIGKGNVTPQSLTPISKSTTSQSTTSLSDPIFVTQTANIQGKISKITGTTATVVNAKDVTKDFPIYSKVVILKTVPGTRSSSASSDIKSVDLNTDAAINLEVIDGKYQIVSVSYLQAPPPPPPPTQ